MGAAQVSDTASVASCHVNCGSFVRRILKATLPASSSTRPAVNLPFFYASAAGLASHPYVYMRWKEQFFVQGSECHLTIQGFYYLCMNR
jgi:hypothetical protein